MIDLIINGITKILENTIGIIMHIILHKFFKKYLNGNQLYLRYKINSPHFNFAQIESAYNNNKSFFVRFLYNSDDPTNKTTCDEIEINIGILFKSYFWDIIFTLIYFNKISKKLEVQKQTLKMKNKVFNKICEKKVDTIIRTNWNNKNLNNMN